MRDDRPHFLLSPFPLFHAGDSGARSEHPKSKATGASVHQKLMRQARDFAASDTASAGASAAPNIRAMMTPETAASTRPIPRKSWKIAVPRPRLSGGRTSARYIGIAIDM